jgi:hypothetical protein
MTGLPHAFPLRRNRLIDARLADAALPSLAVFVLMPEVSDAGSAAMAAAGQPDDGDMSALQDIRARQERHGIDRAPEYGTPHYVEAGDDGSRCAFISSLAATQDFDWFFVVAAGGVYRQRADAPSCIC